MEREQALYKISIYPKPLRTPRYFSFISGYALIKGWYKVPENSIVSINNSDGDVIKVAPGQLIHESDVSNESKSLLVEIKDSDVQVFIGRLIMDYVLSNLPSCLFWSYDEKNLLPATVSREEFSGDPEVCIPLKNLFSLAGIDDASRELKEAIKRSNGLRNVLNRVSTRATKHLKEIWKEYDVEIEISSDGDDLVCAIKDTYNRFDLSRRSDGFKRFITFLIAISAKVKSNELKNVLYLHDEPDIGLHPSSSRYLRDELIRISSENCVVFSTHSIFMIDKSDIGKHLIVEKKDEITIVKDASDSNLVDEEVLYNAVGFSVYDSLKQRNLIFEGWRDKKLFQVAFESSKLKSSAKKVFRETGICHSTGVKNIQNIVPLLDLMERDWIVLSDSDKPAKEKQNQFSSEFKYLKPWFCYDDLYFDRIAYTSEDFIKINHLVSSVNQINSEMKLGIADIKPGDFTDSEERIKTIERWASSKEISKEEKKKILDSIKGKIFESLRVQNIEEGYFDFLSVLANSIV